MDAARRTEPAPETTDETLIRDLAAGRHDALGPLYQRYAPLVYGLAVRSLDRAAAEEVVQDVFLSVWRAAGSFDPARGGVRPWLLQIAHRRILNELRTRSRRPQAAYGAGGLQLVELPDGGPDPADAAWREERHSAVRSAFADLPPVQREAVGLAFFGDLTHQEVASTLGVPLGTVKTRIRAGLQKLRGHLAPLVAAIVLAGGGLLTLLGFRFHAEQQRRGRDERALRLVTSSDTASVRATAAPGAPAEAHATYRGQPGARIAVLTLAHMPPLPAGQVYQAWVRHGDTWISLGTARTDRDGAALLIAEGDALEQMPDALEVTLEPDGGSPSPRGPVVVSWAGR